MSHLPFGVCNRSDINDDTGVLYQHEEHETCKRERKREKQKEEKAIGTQGSVF